MARMKLENNHIQALAFMLMLALISIVWDLGRASALRANALSPNIATSTPIPSPTAPGPLQVGATPSQYGLIQTGVVEIAPMDGNGAATMPVFQVVRLSTPQTNFSVASVKPVVMPPNPEEATAAPIKAPVPTGISMTPPMDTAGMPALCDINNIQVITPSVEACLQAGGRMFPQ